MIDLYNPDHIKLAIIAAAILGCLFGCLVTQFLCNRDWRRYRMLVEQQQAQQKLLVHREPVHHPLKVKDLDHRRGQVIEAQVVLEQA
jgi:hypothetical protein